MQDLIKVKIPNWSKFNPRSDRANYTWFRLENNFFLDQAIFALSDSQKLLYLFLTCEASKKNQDSIEIGIDFIATLLRKDVGAITSDLKAISDRGLIIIEGEISETTDVNPPQESRQDDGKEPSLFPATNERDERDERNETNEQIWAKDFENSGYPQELDFDHLYVQYPQRKGNQRKTKAMEFLKRRIKEPDQYESLEKAIKNYKAHCLREGKIGTPFVCQFATFVNGIWEEWIEPPEITETSVIDERTQKRLAVYESYLSKLDQKAENGGLDVE